MTRTPRTKTGRLELRQYELDHMASQGWRIEHLATPNAIVCRLEKDHGRGPRWDLKIFKGTAAKPQCYYSFKSDERRETYAAEILENIKHWQESRKPRKSPMAADHFTAGDVLYNSWGYDQTNIDWYQVTKVKGKSIWIRPICENSSDAGNCSSGLTQPRRNEFCGEEFRKTVQEGGHVSADHGCMSAWDGKPKYCSTYH
jgi:hypothetical protein